MKNKLQIVKLFGAYAIDRALLIGFSWLMGEISPQAPLVFKILNIIIPAAFVLYFSISLFRWHTTIGRKICRLQTPAELFNRFSLGILMLYFFVVKMGLNFIFEGIYKVMPVSVDIFLSNHWILGYGFSLVISALFLTAVECVVLWTSSQKTAAANAPTEEETKAAPQAQAEPATTTPVPSMSAPTRAKIAGMYFIDYVTIVLIGVFVTPLLAEFIPVGKGPGGGIFSGIILILCYIFMMFLYFIIGHGMGKTLGGFLAGIRTILAPTQKAPGIIAAFGAYLIDLCILGMGMLLMLSLGLTAAAIFIGIYLLLVPLFLCGMPGMKIMGIKFITEN